MIHRTSLIPAYIRFSPGDGLVRSRLALELDRSEKVALSYALGQAMTGIFCSKLLGVSHLMHVDRYARRYGVSFGNTRARADLVGLGPSGWVVAEAKGRSNSMEPDLRRKLLQQKRSVASIGGAPPALALGCVASFPPNNPRLRIDAIDPEEVDSGAIAFDIDLDRFLLAYYEPFLVAIAEGEIRREGDTVIAANFPSARLTVGLLAPLAERLRLAGLGQTRALSESIATILNEYAMETAFPDGTVVETDWSDALTIRDWEA